MRHNYRTPALQSAPAPFILASAVLLLTCSCLDTAAAAESAKVAASSFDWRAFLAPFHSVTVHLPIGFVLLAGILDFYYLLRPSTELRKAVTLVIILSAASAVLVAGLGVLRASGGGYDEATIEKHRAFGIGVAAVTCVMALVDVLAYRGNGKPYLRAVYRTLLIVSLILIGIAGHQGGNLTHGSKYLVENAPEWVKGWLGEEEAEGGDGMHSAQAEIYSQTIQPLFEQKCYQCHGEEKQKGDYRLDTREDALAGGDSELPAVVPYRPMESYLVELITLPRDADEVMPPDGKEELTPREVMDVISWIHLGAPFDEGDELQAASP